MLVEKPCGKERRDVVKKAKQQKRFKEELNTLLARKIDVNLLPEGVKRGVTEDSITLLEAVLLAQINKAIGGDTSSATFLRDTSGNKLKDSCGETETGRSFEDL